MRAGAVGSAGILAALIVALAGPGCGEDETTTTAATATATPTTVREPAPRAPDGPKLNGCPLPESARIQHLRSANGPLEIGTLGSGPTVVLSNQIDESACSWLPFARRLADAGFTAVLYDYAGVADPRDAAEIVHRLSARGVDRIGLVGASAGGSVSIVVAGRQPEAVDAVVSVSAVADAVPGLPASAHRVRAPTLLIAARADVPAGDDVGRLASAIGAARATAVTVRGAFHGTTLIDEVAQVGERAIAFLRRELAP